MAVTVVTQEGHMFQVEMDVAEQSGYLRAQIGSRGGAGDVGTVDDPVELPPLTSSVLTKILDWCTHHRSDPEMPEPLRPYLCMWDVHFFKLPHDRLCELLLAADQLDIPLLIAGLCLTLALAIKGKSAEEIRAAFRLEYDFEPEDEVQIHKENVWADDR